MSQESRSIAFFDLDRTLISVNSATTWIRRELRLGNISRWQAIRGAIWILFYHLGFVRMDRAIRDAVSFLHGKSENEVARRTREFWVEEVVQTIRPGARLAIEDHRSRGDMVVILTSSSSYLCASVMEELPLEEALCNHLEVEDGLFTGTLREPICFGEGKVSHARRLADREGIELEDCSFYTDSYSDLPVLEVVGHPVVVHPDPRLARLARRRGWQIVDWN
jgi:HAD superfamily hydrolase (TIGR01490 family)